MVVLIFIHLTIDEVRNLFMCFCHLRFFFFSIGELLLHIIWPISWIGMGSLCTDDIQNTPLAEV